MTTRRTVTNEYHVCLVHSDGRRELLAPGYREPANGRTELLVQRRKRPGADVRLFRVATDEIAL